MEAQSVIIVSRSTTGIPRPWSNVATVSFIIISNGKAFTYFYSIFSITIFLNKWYCSFSSGAICNFPGTIKLCQSCGNSNVSDTTSFNGRNCRTFFSNYYHILRSETKPWVLHDDSNLDCCWKVYSEGGYKGRSQLISGREWRKGEGWVDTKCTNVEFPIRSLTRVYKSYSELSFSEEP